jgi:hypothetical protein
MGQKLLIVDMYINGPSSTKSILLSLPASNGSSTTGKQNNVNAGHLQHLTFIHEQSKVSISIFSSSSLYALFLIVPTKMKSSNIHFVSTIDTKNDSIKAVLGPGESIQLTSIGSSDYILIPIPMHTHHT